MQSMLRLVAEVRTMSPRVAAAVIPVISTFRSSDHASSAGTECRPLMISGHSEPGMTMSLAI